MATERSTPTASGGRHARAGRPRRRRPLWVAILVDLVAAFLVVSLVQAFLVRVHNVSSGSMEQTLGVSDRVLSSRLPYLTSGPARGDIVVFGHGATWADRALPSDPNPFKAAVRALGDVTGIGISNTSYTVKRVIGVAGDRVTCCDTVGNVEVNDGPLSEPYIYVNLPFVPGALDCSTTPRSTRCFAEIAVPDRRLLVMGDHRSNSSDSVIACRAEDAAPDCAKFVDIDQVSGKVLARAWPPGPVG